MLLEILEAACAGMLRSAKTAQTALPAKCPVAKTVNIDLHIKGDAALAKVCCKWCLLLAWRHERLAKASST